MASGCICGDCWICDELVYEDEVEFIGDNMVHYECKSEYKDHKKQHLNFIKVYKNQIKCMQRMAEELEKIYKELEDENLNGNEEY